MKLNRNLRDGSRLSSLHKCRVSRIGAKENLFLLYCSCFDIYMYVYCIHVCMHVYMYVCMNICMCVYVYVCVQALMYVVVAVVDGIGLYY